jgi:phage gpG-like protein
MPTRIRFEFFGEEQVNRTIMRTVDAADDATPAWEVLAKSFQLAQRKQFRSEGLYGSGGWAPLSPRYAAWKARHYPGAPILVRTGDLRDSLTQRPFGVEVIEPRYAVFGSDVDYGLFHQQGDGVPRRRPVELPESLRRRWVKIIQRFLVTGKASAS